MRICIEDPRYGDQQLEQPKEEAKETVKKKLDLGYFGITNDNEMVDKKMDEEEVEEKLEKAKEVTMHEKRKGG